ncbi:hypothetical protein MMC15_007894 [Xylographa vitiligo]|nr:hypothetical protein [Xylographa vitiligo]
MEISLPEGVLSGFRDVSVNVRQAELRLSERLALANYGKGVHGIGIDTELTKGRSLFQIEGNLRKDGEKSNNAPGSGVWGHVGTLDISRQNRSISLIKLRFDFELNPVCSLERSSKGERKGDANDVSGMVDWVGDWEFAPEDRHSAPRIYDRAWKGWLDWSKITDGSVAHCEDGRWAFIGDRLRGFSVFLTPCYFPYDSNIEVSTTRELKRGQIGWVFRLHERTS